MKKEIRLKSFIYICFRIYNLIYAEKNTYTYLYSFICVDVVLFSQIAETLLGLF